MHLFLVNSINLNFGFISLEIHRSFCEFSSFFAQIYDPLDMFCAKKKKKLHQKSLRISRKANPKLRLLGMSIGNIYLLYSEQIVSRQRGGAKRVRLSSQSFCTLRSFPIFFQIRFSHKTQQLKIRDRDRLVLYFYPLQTPLLFLKVKKQLLSLYLAHLH